MRVLLNPVHASPVLRSLEPAVRRRPRTAPMDVKRLDSDPGVPIYRLRGADRRIAFTIGEDVFILRIFHRSEGHGWLRDLP